MRIGCIIGQLKNAGGVIQLLQLAQMLIKKGHTVIIYTITNDIIDLDPNLLQGLTIKSCNTSIKVEEKPHNQLTGFLLYLWFRFRTTYALVNLLYRDSLDVLNPHEWPAHWPAVFIRWIKGTPIVWICNDVWHIPGNEESIEERIIFSVGNKYVIGIIDKFLTSFVDRIIVLDHRIKGIVDNYYHKESIVIRSGINLNPFKKPISKYEARKRLKLPQGEFIFLSLHAFFRHRRFEDVVNATALLRNIPFNKKFQVYIVGSDKFNPVYSQSIKNLVTENNLREIVTIKSEYLSTKTVLEFFFACDGFIFPNERQTWGIAAIEAMAAGKPCIISKGAGVHEIIDEGQTGLLFTPRDSKELATKMEFLLNHPKRSKEIGEEARKFVFNNFSWDKFTDNVEQILMKIK